MRWQRPRLGFVLGVLLSAPLGAAPLAQQVATPQPTPPSSAPSIDSLGVRGFSVALVLGDMQGGNTPDALPAGAKKAIADMRDFLPYKSYRMLDASWTLCCAGRSGGVSGRLSGLEETEYAFEVYVTGVSGNKMSVTFRLREASAPSAQADEAAAAVMSRIERERMMADLVRERDAVEREYETKSRTLGENHPDMLRLRSRRDSVRRRLEEAERGQVATTARPARSARQIMDSNFAMEAGETVVIGTSRLKSDKALIALLTAATKTSSGR
jgi:hypothetical protein